MSNNFNKMFNDLVGKMDEKMLKAKINSALEKIKNGDTEELAKKINKINKDDFMQKLNEFDPSKLNDLKIDKDDLKKKVRGEDFEKMKNLIGEHGEEIIGKIRDIIK